MAHVGIQRLRAGEREQHRAQHHERGNAVLRRETERVHWIERGQDGGMLDDTVDTHGRQRDEPDHHDRSE